MSKLPIAVIQHELTLATHQVNIGIHITCVPILLLTGFLFVREISERSPRLPTNDLKGTNTPAFPLPPWMTVPNLPANLGTIACVLYSSLYVLMEPVAGGMLAPLLLGGTAYANHLTSTYGMMANYIAIGVHISSWIAQFIGHGIFEGRAPALLDNLVQAVFLAPFFVWLEVLLAFGYRPELKSRLDQSVEKEIARFRAEKSGKGANGHLKANEGDNGHAS